MLHALVTVLAAAAEHAKEEHADKTPFYVAGGFLAAWAVVVAVIGIRTPDFPRSPGQARGVMGLSTVLVVVTLAAAVLTS
jgi:hypothetical protein